MGEDADLDKDEDFEVEPLVVREPDENLRESDDSPSSWSPDWDFEAGVPAVDGMTCAVGMGT